MAAESPKKSDNDYEKIRTLGKYQIVRRLGAGGMGAVFLANDTELKRPVALKVLPKDRAENPILVRRFRAEAQAVAQLRHDNIVSIYETGELQGFPYLALEFVDGPDLLTLIDKKGPLPPKRSLKIVRQVADALRHAGDKNIVHRDIKPSNLLVQVDGTTKITDFGLARSVDETLDTSITRAGTTVGTVDYISPEQACDSKAADIRSDIYSLGCTWYHMVTGQPPFPDGNIQNKLHDHISSPPPNPRQLNPGIPEAYVAVMNRMMAKRPEDRYQTPAELLEDLDQVAGAISNRNAELFDDLPTKAPAPARSKSAPDDATGSQASESKVAKSSGRARSPSNEARAEDLPRDESPPSKINEEWRGRGGPVRNVTPTRGLGNVDDDSESEAAQGDVVGTARKSRKLPPRERKDAGGFAIDVDFLRIGLIGLVVTAALGLFWYAFSRGEKWSPEEPSTTVAAVPEAPPAANPTAPVPPAVGNPTAVVTVDTPSSIATEVALSLADAPVNLRREGPPLTGMDDLPDLNAKAARELAPDWVFALRQAPRDAMPTVTLDSTKTSPVSLNAVLARQSGPQRRLLLKGQGPFTLRPAIINGCERLVIEAAEGDAPVVLLDGWPDGTDDRGQLHLRDGVLELHGLHLVAPSNPQATPKPLLSVTGGTIVFSHGSVTVPNESGPTVLADVVGSKQFHHPSRAWIDSALIRGAKLTVATLIGDHVDVVVTGSLLLGGTSNLIVAEVVPSPESPATATSEPAPAAPEGPPVAQAEAPPPGPAPPADSADEPELNVRLIGSVLSTNGELLQLKQAGSQQILRGSVRLHRSICSARSGTSATLLSLSQWPSRSTSVSGQSKLAGLSWSMDASWIAGWPTLLRVGQETVTDANTWGDFLGRPLAAGSVASQVETGKAINLERVMGDWVKRLNSQVPRELAAAKKQGVPGTWPDPPAEAIDKFLLLTGRPQLPADFESLPEDRKRLQFDLKSVKGDLNELLNGDSVPDGAHVQISGVGLVPLRPLRLSNKSLCIEFIQGGDGGALTIRPDPKPGESAAAWLEVNGGRLDLIGARIQASPSKTRESPSRLVLIRDADFTIRNCSLEGTLASEPDAPGLIDCVQSEAPSRRGYGLIRDTQILGSQPLISADVDRRLLVLSNNLLASRNDGVVFRSRSEPAAIAREQEGWVILQHNTLLFGSVGMRFDGLAAGRQAPAVRLLSRENVFGISPGASAASVLLQHPPSMTAGNLFDWWETRNGYAPAIKQFRRSQPDAAVSEQSFSSDWVGFWTPEHVESPHLGHNAVLFATVLSSLNSLTPPLVSLSRSSSGFSGAEDGSPIGVRPGSVGPLGTVTTAAPATATPGQQGKTLPPSNRPNF
ncbi:MAG: serine/threonine-protein kinase [Planctomycetaceae bacterium]